MYGMNININDDDKFDVENCFQLNRLMRSNEIWRNWEYFQSKRYSVNGIRFEKYSRLNVKTHEKLNDHEQTNLFDAILTGGEE